MTSTTICDPAGPGTTGPGSEPAAVEVGVVTGPAVDGPVVLGPGRHTIGRSSACDVVVADPDVEPHHLLLDVGPHGHLRLLQVAGRQPVFVDGVAHTDWTCPVPATAYVEVAYVEVGSSSLVLRRPSTAGDGHPTPVDLASPVIRQPRTSTPPPSPVVEVDVVDELRPGVHDQSTPVGPLVTGVVVVVGALLMATMVSQPVFAVVTGIGGVVSIVGWVVARVRHRRARRRLIDDHLRSLDAACEHLASWGRSARAAHLARTPTLSTTVAAVGTDAMWACRPRHGDAFVVSIGHGDVDGCLEVCAPHGARPAEVVRDAADRARRLHDVPVAATLDAERSWAMALTGEHAAAVARSMIVQLAVRTGPADWRLVVVTADPTRHAWCRQLPHAGPVAVVDASDPAAVAHHLLALTDGDQRRVVVLTDVVSLLASRTSPLRRLLDLDRPVTVLVQSREPVVPAVCRAVLHTGQRAVGRWHPDAGAPSIETWSAARLRITGASDSLARRTAERLAGFVDPEDPSIGGGRVPTNVRLDDLDGVPRSVDEVVGAWRDGGPDPAPVAVVGLAASGPVEIDLVRDGPHGLIAGTTGSGKSELLRTLVVTLAARCSPDHLTFVLVDYKGGATFDACGDLPHTVGLVTDLDDGLAARALVSLEAELRRRERLLRGSGAVDLTAHRCVAGVAPLPRLVVVVDEFAALAKELPGFVASLVGIAQRGRSLGVHLILATQRPAGVVDDAIRANTDLRLALRLNDVADAHDVVGVADPARFSRHAPGRALLRLGPGEVVEFQTACCTDGAGDTGGAPSGGPSAPSVLRLVVDAVIAAADRLGVAPPHRPWLPALSAPGSMSADAASDVLPSTGDGPVADPDVDRDARPGHEPSAVVVGEVDDPAAQRRRPMAWSRRGSLALVGSLGSGTTTTLVAIGRSVLATTESPVFAIDARGDAAMETFGSVSASDRERVERVLDRVLGEIDRRRAAASRTLDRAVPWVLLVDGLVTLRRHLDEPGTTALARLDRVLAEGPAVGVVAVAVVEAEGGASSGVLTRFAERWVFRLDDPSSGPTFGIPTALVPSLAPGRVVVASSGLEGQVDPVEPAPDPAEGRPVERVDVLPDSLCGACTFGGDPSGTPLVSGAVTSLRVGRRYDDLGAACVEVVAGEHVLVLGPARSGRSTVLVRLATDWRHRHPGGLVSVLAPSPRSPVADLGDDGSGRLVDVATIPDVDGPHLVVIDDAERVDDVGGRLVALVESGPPGLLVVAAGRPESLRAAFGHWTSAVRRSRSGIVMAQSSELDGDLLGASLPRRCPIAPRPGLAWIVHAGSAHLAQVASDGPCRPSCPPWVSEVPGDGGTAR